MQATVGPELHLQPAAVREDPLPAMKLPVGEIRTQTRPRETNGEAVKPRAGLAPLIRGVVGVREHRDN
eukprot:10210188-Lingulodinium_polyedra.AAC.1